MTLDELKSLNQLLADVDESKARAIINSLHLELALSALQGGLLLHDQDVSNLIAAKRASRPKVSIAIADTNVPFKI